MTVDSCCQTAIRTIEEGCLLAEPHLVFQRAHEIQTYKHSDDPFAETCLISAAVDPLEVARSRMTMVGSR